ESNGRLSFRALVEIDERMEEEQEVTVYAMTRPDYYRVDLEWALRAKSGGEVPAARENGIIARMAGGQVTPFGDAIDISNGAAGVALVGSIKNPAFKLAA